MIKLVALNTLLATAILGLISYRFFGAETAATCIFGGVLMIINLLGLSFIWKLIITKKSIALAVLVIIFKYLILGLALWSIRQAEWVKPIGFVLGISSLVLGILSFSVYKKFFLNS